MGALAYLEFAFALASVIGCIALIIARLHLIERVEEHEWQQELTERIVNLQ